MNKERLLAIDYIRGLSMLGVIGIHMGATYLENPSANPHIVALLEIVTRFSVPIFFFISAFGLLYGRRKSGASCACADTSASVRVGRRKSGASRTYADTRPSMTVGRRKSGASRTYADTIETKHRYLSFIRRRFHAVLIPYLAWSLFYIFFRSWFYSAPPQESVFSALFFGNSMYHLYFMVILIWFYITMPFWTYVITHISFKGLLLILVLQIVFNYFSSYSSALYQFAMGLPDGFLKNLLIFRVNYLVLHYGFIFILGGWLAVHFDAWQSFMEKNFKLLTLGFAASLGTILGYYYYLLGIQGKSALEAVFIAHQLSPPGVIYTVAASLFFFAFFTLRPYPGSLNKILDLLGRHSYFIYLAHPVVLAGLTLIIPRLGFLMTSSVIFCLYLSVLALTLLAAILVRRAGDKLPLINLLTIGKR